MAPGQIRPKPCAERSAPRRPAGYGDRGLLLPTAGPWRSARWWRWNIWHAAASAFGLSLPIEAIQRGGLGDQGPRPRRLGRGFITVAEAAPRIARMLGHGLEYCVP